MKRLMKILDFCRLLDELGTLSLSNIAMIVVIAKMAITPTFSLAEAALLLPVIGNYTFKRFYQRRHRYSQVAIVPANNLDEAKLQALSNDVDRIKLAMGFRNVKQNS